MSGDISLITVVITGVISALTSGLVGVGLSIVYYRRHESRQVRRDTLRRLAANRHDLTGDEFSRSLNETLIVFNNSKAVVEALRRFGSARTDENLVSLIQAIGRDVGLRVDRLDSDLLLTAFNIRD